MVMAGTLAVEGEQVPTGLEPLLKRIDDFRYAESHLDPHDHQLVSDNTISAAKRFLQCIASEAQEKAVPWRDPMVAWDEDGRISLLWRQEGETMFILSGALREPIICVICEPGQRPIRKLISVRDAIERALQRMGTT